MEEGSTGLYYMRTREYDSVTARLLSPKRVSTMNSNPYVGFPEDGRQDRLSHVELVITRYFKPAELISAGVKLLPKAPQAPGIFDLTRDLDRQPRKGPIFDPFPSSSDRDEFKFLPFISNATDLVNEFYVSSVPR